LKTLLPITITRRSALAIPFGAAIHLRAAQSALPAPYGALPAERQLRWHQLETYSFLHFTVNTFTGREWGEGDEDPNIFHPTDFQPDQMMRALKSAGMKAVILTCKHHDGFCLWPTKTTDHSIRKSSWRDGKGDVVRDISEAARRHGLKFGVYLSPWDRNNAAYGKPEYIAIYRAQLRELLTQYGSIFEVWHDGANGGTGYYGGAREKRVIDKRTYYDWPNTWALIRELQPEAVIFSDVGPDIRWVGNEKGIAGETCWETYDPEGEHGGPASPGDVNARQSPIGTRNGKHWLPPECDVSIRPGWFWHAEENAKVKSAADLMDLYYKSVGRGASFLLNVPPDRRGQFSDPDVQSLAAFGLMRERTFGKNLAAKAKVIASNVRGNTPKFGGRNAVDGKRDTYWATDDGVNDPEITLAFARPVTFNVIRIREYIPLGQRIAAFTLEAETGGEWRTLANGTSIGNCRLVRLPEEATAGKVKLRITDCPVCPALSEFALFRESPVKA
jgi:alpha-L-fucosidase